MLQNGILQEFYIKDSDDIKPGTIVYGKSGLPLEVVSMGVDTLVLKHPDGNQLRTKLSSIKLVHNSEYGGFDWIVPPSQRWDEARANGEAYSLYQSIAIGKWTKPAQETYSDGTTANKQRTDAAGNKRAIPSSLRDIKDNPTYGGSCAAFTANGGESIVLDTMILLGLRDAQKKLSNLKLKQSVIDLKLRDDSRLELTNDEIHSR